MPLTIPENGKHRIVIIGAGFAGLEMAKSLAGKAGIQVVLLDLHNYHTFQPLLYQVATAGLQPDSIAYPLRRIFRGKTNVHVRMTQVQQVDPVNRMIETTQGTLRYDDLVIATGSKPKFFGSFVGIQDQLMTLKTLPNALDLRSMVNQQFEKALERTDPEWRMRCLSVGIVGGGPTGVELAGALAEMRRFVLPQDYPDMDFSLMQIVLYEAAPKLLGAMSAQASEKAERYLQKLGVDLRLANPVKDYEDGSLIDSTGHRLATDTVIWTAGVEGAPVLGLPSQSIDRGNRLEVNTLHQIKGTEHLYALGDVAAMESEQYPKGHPMLAPVAQQQAKNLAENFLRVKAGKEPQPFTYNDQGSMATVGRNKAVVDFPKLKFQGAVAWFIWMFVHVYSLIGFKNRLVALLDWSFSYFTYDRSLSLIIRPFRKPEWSRKTKEVESTSVENTALKNELTKEKVG